MSALSICVSLVLRSDGWVSKEDSSVGKMMPRTCSCHHHQPIVDAPFPSFSTQSVPIPKSALLFLLIFIVLNPMCLPCFTWNWAKHEDPLDALESMPQQHTWVHDGRSWVLKPTVGISSFLCCYSLALFSFSLAAAPPPQLLLSHFSPCPHPHFSSSSAASLRLATLIALALLFLYRALSRPRR